MVRVKQVCRKAPSNHVPVSYEQLMARREEEQLAKQKEDQGKSEEVPVGPTHLVTSNVTRRAPTNSSHERTDVTTCHDESENQAGKSTKKAIPASSTVIHSHPYFLRSKKRSI